MKRVIGKKKKNGNNVLLPIVTIALYMRYLP